MFSYQPLNILLAEKNMSKTQLMKEIKVSSATIAKFKKNETVNMEVLGKICKKLDCKIDDIVKYVNEQE
ncbi:MAG: helix-turn-helix transcriptional regulator [Clostridia bacterium]|nr:helix-turn-helix transcriptional regulator [Clostridia bacterium]